MENITYDSMKAKEANNEEFTVKEKVLTVLHHACIQYCTIGSPGETPRFFCLWIDQDMSEGSLSLYLQSTQRERLRFDLDIPTEEVMEFLKEINADTRYYPVTAPHEAWFRDARNKYIAENFPTISLK